MPKNTTTNTSAGHAKLTSFIHYSLVDIFSRLGLNTFRGSLVTITEVTLTAEKNICKIYISIMNESLYRELLDELEIKKSDIKKQISYVLKNKMRFVPSDYVFYADKTAAEASKIIQLIDKLSANSDVSPSDNTI